MNATKLSAREAQELGRDLVGREVYAMASTLVADLVTWDKDPQWEETLELVNPGCPECQGSGKAEQADDEGDTSEVECECCGGEGSFEALEHWVVSDWLAEKLRAQGEHVAEDWHGLTVWARCTSGQAIAIDDCIEAIVRELHEKS